VAHNTLLLNGYPESQRLADLDDEVSARNEFPRIVSCFTGGSFDAAEGELSCVYKGRLSKYSRSILYLKHIDTLVLCDEIDAVVPERFSWVFHTEGKDSFRGEENSVRVVRPKAELRMEILSPERLDRAVKPHPDRDGSYLMLSALEASDRGKFLAVLTPSSSKNRAERESWTTVPFEAKGWSGAEIRRGDVADRVLFRTAGGGAALPMGRGETDGDRAALTISPDGGLERVWVRNATLLREAGDSGTPVFRSDGRLTILADYVKGEGLIEVESEQGTVISLKAAQKPATVLVDGASAGFSYDSRTGMLTMRLPPGHHSINAR
jgi:hypothetical protein